MHNNTYVQNFMAYYEYPQEVVDTFTNVENMLDNNKEAGQKFDALMADYKEGKMDFGKVLEGLDELSEIIGIDERTLKFVFIMNASEWVLDRYKEQNIAEEIFWDTFRDLRYKLFECINVEHTIGTFVAGWFGLHLSNKIFALGRFQYEVGTAHLDNSVTVGGVTINPGDPILGLHIPSSGVPLTDEIRYDSYKKAYNFFKGMFPDNKLHIICGSWLLYPRSKEFLPPHLNVLRFLDDFTIVHWNEKENFGDDWRLFGDYTDLPLEQWPTDTSMRKAYKEWLMAGNKTGDGVGIIIFDGEKILK